MNRISPDYVPTVARGTLFATVIAVGVPVLAYLVHIAIVRIRSGSSSSLTIDPVRVSTGSSSPLVIDRARIQDLQIALSSIDCVLLLHQETNKELYDFYAKYWKEIDASEESDARSRPPRKAFEQILFLQRLHSSFKEFHSYLEDRPGNVKLKSFEHISAVEKVKDIFLEMSPPVDFIRDNNKLIVVLEAIGKKFDDSVEALCDLEQMLVLRGISETDDPIPEKILVQEEKVCTNVASAINSLNDFFTEVVTFRKNFASVMLALGFTL